MDSDISESPEDDHSFSPEKVIMIYFMQLVLK